VIYTENRTIVAREGDDETRLSAEFCSNPMVNKVFWIASDRVIRPGTAVGQITAHSITVSLERKTYFIFVRITTTAGTVVVCGVSIDFV